jgi:hypothetical protein
MPFGDQNQCSTVGKYQVCTNYLLDTETNLIWQRFHSAYGMARYRGEQYCGAFGLRLPTVAEMKTLLDPTQASAPYMDRTIFPTAPSTTAWASDGAVDFTKPDGAAPAYAADSKLDVRCVIEQ